MNENQSCGFWKEQRINCSWNKGEGSSLWLCHFYIRPKYRGTIAAILLRVYRAWMPLPFRFSHTSRKQLNYMAHKDSSAHNFRIDKPCNRITQITSTWTVWSGIILWCYWHCWLHKRPTALDTLSLSLSPPSLAHSLCAQLVPSLSSLILHPSTSMS